MHAYYTYASINHNYICRNNLVSLISPWYAQLGFSLINVPLYSLWLHIYIIHMVYVMNKYGNFLPYDSFRSLKSRFIFVMCE